MLSGGGLLVRICVHLNREGHATFSPPIKVHHVCQSSLYEQKDMACFTTADKGITPANTSFRQDSLHFPYSGSSSWRRGINLVPSTAVSAILDSDIWAPGILHILRPGYCCTTSGYLLIIDRRTHASQYTLGSSSQISSDISGKAVCGTRSHLRWQRGGSRIPPAGIPTCLWTIKLVSATPKWP